MSRRLLSWFLVTILFPGTASFLIRTPMAWSAGPDSVAIDPHAAAVVHRLVDFGHSLHAYQVDVTTRLSMAGPAMNMTQSGRRFLAFESPNRVVMLPSEGVMPAATVVSDGIMLHAMFTIPMQGTKYIEQPVPATTAELFALPDWNGFAGQEGMVMSWLTGPGGYESLMEGVISASYAGRDTAGGVECDRLHFVQEDYVWDLWVETGERPLIRRVKPDMTKSAEAAADMSPGMKDVRMDMSVDYDGWKLDTPIDPALFAFSPPEGAQKVESLFGAILGSSDAMIGEPAPPFELERLDGGKASLADHAGKEDVILDFWATWCGPCRKSMPIIAAVAGEFRDRGVMTYAVNQRESPEKIRTYLEKSRIDLPILLDRDGRIGMKYEALGIPRTVIIGRDGRVKSVHAGYSPELEARLRSELGALVEGREIGEGAAAGGSGH